jgi:hypothetical protein
MEMANPQTNDYEAMIYLCPQCGAWLHPGWQGSTMRVARLPHDTANHRTKRRRIQRQKRRAMLMQSKKAKEFNGNKPTGSTVKVEKVLLRDDSDLFLDRHHLMIRCGRCDAKIRIKGLKRESPPTKQMIQQTQLEKGAVNLRRNDKKLLSSYPPPPSHSVSNSLGDGDFLQLPPGPSKATTKATNTLLSKHTPLHLRNPKKSKNKPKGSGGKDSKLLNFLSSLND